MEITRSTFAKALPIVESAIKQATFLAIDGEYTGLQTSKNKAYSFLDDIQMRYEKVKDSAQSFSVLQFGITAFKWSPDQKCYDVKPFAFYLFSDPSKAIGLDRRFTFQASSASFLAEYKFDFNKVFYEGIPFLSQQEEKMFRRKKSSAEGNDTHPILTLNEETQAFVDQIFLLVDSWLQNEAKPELNLPTCNSYQRLILYQQIRIKYNDFLTLSKRMDSKNCPYLVVQKLTADEKSCIEKETQETAENDLQAQIGFRQVIDFLIEAKKPIIAHNSMLDFCHIYAKFIDRLPDNVLDFKTQLNELFPIIFDTKIIATSETFKSQFEENSSLSELYKYVSESKFTNENLNFDFQETFNTYIKNVTSFHDAGYDSFCTGFVFAQLLHHLKEKEPDNEKMDRIQLFTTRGYLNKLFMMKSDYECFDLVEPEKQPDRSKLFYVFGFPKDWKNSDLGNHFGKYGPFRIYWIDDISLFLAFHNSDNEAYGRFVKEIFQEKHTPGEEEGELKQFSIISYNDYLAKDLGNQSTNNYTPSRGRQLDTPGSKRKRT